MGGKILILGSGGRLGAALRRAWSEAGDAVEGLSHAELDLGDLGALRETLERTPFDALVNCAALTNVDYCETHSEEAHRINAEAVRTIGEVCARRSARCVHISTDYVFDGAARTPYTEEDAAAPLGVYGASKLAGEQALFATEGGHLAVRVSWVFGPDRPSFVDQILQRARQEEKAAAIADKWAVPTYTLDVARLLRPFLFEVPESGLLHLCNAGACTWQEYGQFALDCAREEGVALKAATVEALRMADLAAFVARRPPYTVMSTAKLERLGSAAPRPWEAAVQEYIRDSWAPRHRG